MKSWFILAGSAAVLGLGAVIIFAFAQPYVLHGSVIEPPRPAPPISLPASDGTMYRLDQQRGKLVLLFFGYTSCPDVCPATLSEMRQVMAGLGERANSVQIVFITVDPQRDTAEKLQRYLSVFGPSFVGLSGSIDQMEPVWKEYGVYRQIQPVGTGDNYMVDHSAFIYVIDKSNQLRMTYPFGTDVDFILKDVAFLLKEG
jgi:protein SCO1/2